MLGDPVAELSILHQCLGRGLCKRLALSVLMTGPHLRTGGAMPLMILVHVMATCCAVSFSAEVCAEVALAALVVGCGRCGPRRPPKPGSHALRAGWPWWSSLRASVGSAEASWDQSASTPQDLESWPPAPQKNAVNGRLG